MTEAWAADYLDDISFELLVISRCSPLMDTTQQASATYNMQTNQMLVSMAITDTAGMTLRQAVDKLGMRPLAFGAAWKCLDLLLEHALAADGHAGSGKAGRWHIAEKIRHAQALHGQAKPLSSSPDVWKRLTAVYIATEQVRHSLVHRSAKTDANNNLVGVDEAGAPLRPLTVTEQEAMLRVAQRVADTMQTGVMSPREETALMAEFDTMAAVTGLPTAGAVVVRHPPVLIDVPVLHGQEINLAAVKARLRGTFPAVGEIDMRFQLGDDTWTAYLEEVPDDTVTFDPEALDWLRPGSTSS